MTELHYIEMDSSSHLAATRIIERFAGDPTATLANLANNGLVVGRIAEAPEPTEVEIKEEPKEWIERQEEERRAWAVREAIRVIRESDSWTIDALIDTAEKIETYVKGSNPDINDVDATDMFYLVMGRSLMELEQITEDGLEDFLVDCLDQMAKNGVRLKDGKKLEDEA